MNSSKNYIIVVLLIVVATLTALVYTDANKSENNEVVVVDTTANTELTSEETSILAANIRELILVPDEAPSFSVVRNAENLRAEQSFYARAEQGDVIAVYPQNRLAILYRPSEHVLINVGPLYFEEQATSTTSTITQ